MKIEDVINTAIKMEEEGYAFYRKAENRTASKLGKAMFDQLAFDEVKHKRMLERMRDSVPQDAKDMEVPLAKERLKSVFADAKANFNETISSTADDIEALSFAMTKEKESHDMYRGAAQNSTDPAVKAAFNRMALEEDHHYEILQETRYYLEQYNNWSIWEEGGPIEGG
ncbi:MAG TPA: ferritin family protein [Nitrospirota bacterium]|jgi:rubrerythrin